MSTSGSGSVLMRACQVVGEKGVYKALVDAVDDAGDWTHQQLANDCAAVWHCLPHASIGH